MKLVNYHRVELVEQLKAAYEEKEEISQELGQAQDIKDESALEVKFVLVQSKIDLIQKILVEGEMDY